nr:SEL1-like repeat protein [Citrobacter sp. wls613]
MAMLIGVFNLFPPSKGYAAVCQERYPPNSEECQYVQETERKAKQGANFSYFVIGYHYNYGKNFPLDKQEALKWYCKASDNGLIAF